MEMPEIKRMSKVEEMARTLRPASLRRPPTRLVVEAAKGVKGVKAPKGSKKPTIDRAYIKKSSIPKALRTQVWLTFSGEVFKRKCYIPWCQNNMTVFDFHVGHDIPESRGGRTEVSNLRPICSQCNLSMSNKYTVTEWSRLSQPVRQKRGWISFLFQCFRRNQQKPKTHHQN